MSFSTSTRDTQRQKLYDAEREALERFKTPVPTVEGVQRYVDRVLSSKRVLKRHPHLPRQRGVGVKDGRGTRHAYAHGQNVISVPLWARKDWVVLHELAHILEQREWWSHTEERRRELRESDPARRQSHGWRFAAIYLDLVLLFMGRPARDALRASFRKHRVRYTPKRRMSPETIERLRERGRLMAAARVASRPAE